MKLHDWRVVNNVRLKYMRRYEKVAFKCIEATPINHLTVIENPRTCSINIYLRIGKKSPLLKALVPRYFYPKNSSVLRVSMFLDDLTTKDNATKIALRSKKIRTEVRRKNARRRK